MYIGTCKDGCFPVIYIKHISFIFYTGIVMVFLRAWSYCRVVESIYLLGSGPKTNPVRLWPFLRSKILQGFLVYYPPKLHWNPVSVVPRCLRKIWGRLEKTQTTHLHIFIKHEITCVKESFLENSPNRS